VKTTLIGIGNVLLGDDGAGVWLVRRLLAGYRFDPEIEILDGGTLGLGLATYVAETDRLLIVDAVASAAPPGTVVVLRGPDVPAVIRTALSAHEASLCDLLAALTLLGTMPREVVAIGVVPQDLLPGVTLSDPVRAGLDEAEEAVLAQLRAWNIGVTNTGAVAETVLSL
jgi:hydrogenase maturation protease